jgi:Holliday junction resolvasome RuvABC endonuclease subunit
VIICGIDASTNSTGVVKLTLDDNFNVIEKDYLGFVQTEKYKTEKIRFHHKENAFKNLPEKWNFMTSNIISFISAADYIAQESYSYGSKGAAIFEIGEISGIIKQKIWDFGIKHRLYEPTTIKMFATDNGKSNKIDMYSAYMDLKDGFDLSKFPVPVKSDGASPTSDIVDAHWIALLLLLELKIRNGIVKVDDLPTKKQQSIFKKPKKVKKMKKLVSLLDTPFIQKENK